MADEETDKDANSTDGIIELLRFIVGLIGASLIQQGYSLTTQPHLDLISMIAKFIQGISNVLTGFLLVILAIRPNLTSRILDFLLEKLGRYQDRGPVSSVSFTYQVADTKIEAQIANLNEDTKEKIIEAILAPFRRSEK